MIPRGKKIYLCRPDLSIITELNGVHTDEVEYNAHVKDFDELHITVDRYINVNGELVESNGYELLDVYLNLYLEDIGNFQMQTPLTTNDGFKETKTITAYSLDKEWEQHDWVGFKVNTGEPDSLEQLAEDNVDELGFAKEFVQFYRPDKKDLSLVHLLLTKMPSWSVRDEDIDPILWSKVSRFESDNSSIYAIATSIIAPKVECIWLFDTINRRVKAISKERLNDYTYDTNIFIGFRNLANMVDIDVDEDSVFTRFNARGDNDLKVLDVNFGDMRVMDYSYFMHEPYMSATLASKMQTWLDWRDNNREAYIALAKRTAELNNDIYEVKYRVPNDGVDWSQWDNMTEELLNQNLRYYNAELTFLQVSVDPNPQYDSEDNYIPWKNQSGQVDHDRYLQELYNLGNGYGGYYTYYEILHYIIPNIEIAIENLDVPESQKRDYIKEYETNWDLYGIEELQGKRDDYNNRLDTLSNYSKPWSQLTEEEKAAHMNSEAQYNADGRTLYLEYSGYLGDETTEGTLLYKLAQLKTELATYENQLETINTQTANMANHASYDYSGWNFTDAEKKIIDTLGHETDYTNNNILTTSVDTTITTIEMERELYDDAVSKLSEVSQPQYRFSVDLDNLLNIPEFEGWKERFQLLNFFRLGIRDDYSVKLRMIGYSYNPCEITDELNIEFSSMITSRSGRSDLTDLLNSEGNRASKNSISIGNGNASTDKEYLTDLLQLLTKSTVFKNSVSQIAGNIVVSSGVDGGVIGAYVADYLKVAKIDVTNITGEEADFEALFAKYIDADEIVADSGTFTNLRSDFLKAKTAVFGQTASEDTYIINLTAANATMDTNFAKSIIASKITVGDLATHNATADQIVLISENGDPAIAFKNATQQFYDANGNVRVQIGQDGNGNFNFIVVGADGSTALFDSNGITQNGVPSGTIINRMIADSTVDQQGNRTGITKSKLAFDILEPNAYGGIDITQVYDGGNNWFGTEYTSFKTGTNSAISALQQTVADLSDDVAAVELTGSQVFVQDSSGSLSPNYITVTAVTYNDFQIGKWYVDGVENTSWVSQDKKSIQIPSSAIANANTLTVKCEGVDTTKYDTFTIYRVANGRDTYSVVIDSEDGVPFKGDTATTARVTCTVYQGSTVITPRSYLWQYLNDNGTWTNLGYITNPIDLPLSPSVIKKKVRCVVEV